MVVRVERVVDVPATPEAVWEFLDDPKRRAENISVVDEYDILEDGRAIWHVNIPVPLVRRTIAIETAEQIREPPIRVQFRGNSRVFSVVGEHLLEATEEGTRLTNRFTVDGKLPGVETYFKRQMGDELDSLETALLEYLQGKGA